MTEWFFDGVTNYSHEAEVLNTSDVVTMATFNS